MYLKGKVKKSFMNVTIFKVVFLSIIGIGHSQDWNIVDLGPFSVELPNGFKKESLGSPDSYAMKIEIDSTIFYFDYGYYSPQITLTAKEYITSEKWIYSGDFDLLFLDKANIKIISVDRRFNYQMHTFRFSTKPPSYKIF